jgi:hypothetical protein
MMKKRSMLLLALMFAVAGSQDAFAKSKKEKKAEAAAKAAQEAQMAEVMKRGMPGEAHKALEPFVGSWTHVLRWWHAPNTPPDEMRGTNVNSWMFGGRFLKQEVKGGSPEMPWEGLGIIGYDNIAGRYESVWFDGMATGIAHAHGAWDPAAKTLTETGTMSDMMTNTKDKPFRGVWKSIDANTNLYEMFTTAPDGKEYRNMEIIYTRAQ